MKLSKYQRVERDAATGIVRIMDGSIGGAHSAHPNVEANKYNRRTHPTWREAWGFLYSPEVFTSTDEDKYAAKLCCCSACKR